MCIHIRINMTDIFDAKIMCKNCNVEMKPVIVKKNGLELRAVECARCDDKIIHPADLNGMEKFKDLKGKTFSVKLRMVGNSHAISIPKEIVDFMNEMNRMHSETRSQMDDMVRLCFEDFRKLSLNFGEDLEDEDDYNEEHEINEESDIDEMRIKRSKRRRDQ